MKIRLFFEKSDEGRYISHLDLNRMFMRALKRAQIDVVYTQGFNPHPYLVFSPPLSLGYIGTREILDLSVEPDIDYDELVRRLRTALPNGIRPTDAAEPVKKLGDIAFARYHIDLLMRDEAAAGVCREGIKKLFSSKELVLTKRTKRGEAEVDVMPLIRSMKTGKRGNTVTLDCVLACSPSMSLNPELLLTAADDWVEGYEPQLVTVERRGFLDAEGKDFA